MASRRLSCLLNSAIHLSICHPQPEFLPGWQLCDTFENAAVLIASHRVATTEHPQRAQCIQTCAVRREPRARTLESVIHATREAISGALQTLDHVPGRNPQRAR